MDPLLEGAFTVVLLRRSGSEKDLWDEAGFAAIPTPPLLAFTDGGSISASGTSTGGILGSTVSSASVFGLAS